MWFRQMLEDPLPIPHGIIRGQWECDSREGWTGGTGRGFVICTSPFVLQIKLDMLERGRELNIFNFQLYYVSPLLLRSFRLQLHVIPQHRPPCPAGRSGRRVSELSDETQPPGGVAERGWSQACCVTHLSPYLSCQLSWWAPLCKSVSGRSPSSHSPPSRRRCLGRARPPRLPQHLSVGTGHHCPSQSPAALLAHQVRPDCLLPSKEREWGF